MIADSRAEACKSLFAEITDVILHDQTLQDACPIRLEFRGYSSSSGLCFVSAPLLNRSDYAKRIGPTWLVSLIRNQLFNAPSSIHLRMVSIIP